MRYLPLSESDRRQMLAQTGVANMDAFFADVPARARLVKPLDLPPSADEMAVKRAFRDLAARNTNADDAPFFVGAGAYRHHIPASVDHIIQRSEFMTAYTPYQPEIAQGTLQALFEFQTQVAVLTGMDVANASMYDGASACAEAVLMAHRLTKRGRALVSAALHPHYAETLKSVSDYAGHSVETCAHEAGDVDALIAQIDDATSCVVVQNPDVFGAPADLSALADAAHAKGALLIVVVTEIISLGALQSPGEMGADIVAGEGQSLGNALSFGGPYVGLFATRRRYVRQMPGRLCGQTTDADGRTGYVLTLATREQHIRRDKATSNICTNAGLCALAFTCHMALLGGEGLARLARLNHARAGRLMEALTAIDGVSCRTPVFFNEFTLRLPSDATEIVDALAERGILAGVPVRRLILAHDARDIVVAATEMVSDEDIAAYADALKAVLA